MTNEDKAKIDVVDFDLPELESNNTPRVHRGPGDSTCTSCEG